MQSRLLARTPEELIVPQLQLLERREIPQPQRLPPAQVAVVDADRLEGMLGRVESEDVVSGVGGGFDGFGHGGVVGGHSHGEGLEGFGVE